MNEITSTVQSVRKSLLELIDCCELPWMVFNDCFREMCVCFFHALTTCMSHGLWWWFDRYSFRSEPINICMQKWHAVGEVWYRCRSACVSHRLAIDRCVCARQICSHFEFGQRAQHTIILRPRHLDHANSALISVRNINGLCLDHAVRCSHSPPMRMKTCIFRTSLHFSFSFT